MTKWTRALLYFLGAYLVVLLILIVVRFLQVIRL
jgi:hypothetical protein